MNLFISCPKGIEPLLADELQALGFKPEAVRPTAAGVHLEGELADAYRVCLWSRLANRVLLPLINAEVTDADSLYALVQQVNWLEHMRSTATLAIDFNGSSEQINNTRFGAQKVKDAIVDQIRKQTGNRPTVERNQPDIRVNAYLNRGKLQLSLDLSGDSLHRRAYRLKAGSAPMKENLAAAILYRADWPDTDNPIVLDPMCGSGTLLIEAAMMFSDIAPGLSRHYFGFQGWLQHRREIWNDLLAEARERRTQGIATMPATLIGRDLDERVLAIAEQNAERAGVAELIRFEQAPVEKLTRESLPEGKGLLVTNPPYGERMGDSARLMFFYRQLGGLFREQLGGWKIAVYTGNPSLTEVMGLRPDKQYQMYNGALEGRLALFSIHEKRLPPRQQAEQGVGQCDVEQKATTVDVPPEVRDMFANRLRKNLRQLKKWVKKEHIDAYRLYDADIPEFAVAVDIYGEHVHVQEYAPPRKVDPVKAFERLQAVMLAVPDVLQVPAENVVLKQRRRQSGKNQYEKQGESQHFRTVMEHGCEFRVNLRDYLDTGLFLDHRPVRHRIQQLAAGKDMLNLFCYTATASVHAARGGAASTTSVDMSSTYLQWGQRNMSLNGFAEGRHQFIQEDCFKWLKRQRGAQFDLIFMDPPTFSNSKRMEGVLDVQRDHAGLVKLAMKLLRPGGLLIFSNNYRRFQIDRGALAEFEIKDITAQTLDPDFKRNSRIHVCFEVRHANQA
ncbi:MAG: bifunctional 23S rRNA (guanine(2069)-N(7))-methyltransferase RlmK/23S rRNA (guanine(2445)-N(2))-methyltransferase RlmL [Marinobacterium sp.]|nr:bifunctional 23S rRNA (guanine(2069)-N(7))-methyltransferase RlmK/23S rRNA (guanine(2445)-N(2))-methyltransferase RlmL [Marinobacterium sp.]